MTQSGQVTLHSWSESILGQLPATVNATAVRMIQENFFVGPNLVDSPEVTAGNEPEDQVNNGFEGGGDLQFAFSPRNYDDYFQSLLWASAWAAQPGSAATPIRTTGAAEVTWTAATRTLTTTGSWTNAPSDGDHVLVRGSGNAYLDGIHRVESSTGTTIVLEEDGILSNASKVPDISVARDITIIRGEVISNSLTPTQQSFGFEKATQRVRGTHKGVTATPGAPVTDRSQFYGGIPTRCQFQGTGDSPITGSFTFDMTREESEASSVINGSTTASAATPIFQGIECIKKCRLYVPDISATAGNPGVIEDTLRICPQSIQVELANGMITTPLMCAEPEKDYQFGEPLFSTQVTGIYESPFPREAFNGQFDGVFELAMVATNGDGYLFRAPRAKVQIARNDTTGRRQTIQSQFTVRAFKQTASPVPDGDTGRAVEIIRFRQP